MASKANTGNKEASLKKYFTAIFFLVFLVYGNSIKNRYSLDDNYVTVTDTKTGGNPLVSKGFGGISKIFTSHFVESKEQSFEYRPVPLTTFAIEYAFFGSNPHVNHFVNVLIYALTCCLLFYVLRNMFSSYSILFPLIITLLFLFHPIHTEVVCNIKCRDELLAFFFGLCALHFFMKSNGAQEKIKYILFSAACLLLAILCKKTAVLFIALIPMVSYFFYNASLRNVAVQMLLFYLIFVVFTLMERLLLPPGETRIFAFFENPLFYDHSLISKIKFSLSTLGYYFRLLVFPNPLCSYYGYNVVSGDGNLLLLILSAALYLCLTGYALGGLPARKNISFAFLVFLIGLFPFSNLATPMVGIIAERFIYFASMGFCIMAAIVLFKLFKVDFEKASIDLKQISLNFKGALFILFFMCGIAVVARSNSWKDSITLLRKDARNFPESCNLHYLIGTNLFPQIISMKDGQQRRALIQEAKAHYREAVLLMEEGITKYPDDYTTTANIGTVYMNVFNDPRRAQGFFRRSLRVNPVNPVARFNYVFCYEKQDLIDSAIVGYEKLIADSVTYPGVFLQLHEIYLKKQDYIKAIECNKKGVKKNPKEPRLYVNLGNAQVLAKDTVGAVESYQKAIELDPANVSLRSQVMRFINKEAPIK
ncbi:MAG: hypothetical protein ACXVPN_07095 [Bacteroidia bacterium]